MTADGRAHRAGLDQLATTVQEAVDLAGLPDIVSVTQTERGLVITRLDRRPAVRARVGAVAAGGADVLAVLTPALGGFNNKVLVEGHTDKRPLQAGRLRQLGPLGRPRGRRGQAFRDQFGLDPLRLSAAGYGEMRPVAEGDDESSFAKNRRVEIVVLAAIDSGRHCDRRRCDRRHCDRRHRDRRRDRAAVSEPPGVEPEVGVDPLVPAPAGG